MRGKTHNDDVKSSWCRYCIRFF